MANKFFRNITGNYTDDTSWSTTSGGANDTTKPTAADDVKFDANSGACTISAASVAKTVDCTGYTNTLTHNAFSWTISGSLTLVSGMTYTPLVTSTISFNATATLTTGGKLIPLLTHTSGTLTLGDNLSFMASKVMTFTLSGTAVDMNGKNINGNSSINRILISSATVGTGKQITVNSGTFTNADFQDITFSNATNLDLSAITGNSGDCGGNTITGGGSTLTFTTTATQTWAGTSGGNWSTNAWTSRVPLPQDNVIISSAFSASQTVTSDMPRLGKSINWTGVTGSPTWNFGSLTTNVYGSITLASGMIISGTLPTVLCGRSSFAITSAGVSWTNIFTITAPGGTYTLQDAYNHTGTGRLQVNNGGFDANNFNVTIDNFNSSASTTRSVTMGTGIWTLTSIGGAAWNIATTTNLTFSGASATIILSGIAGVTKNFFGGGLTYGNLIYTVAGSIGELDITGSNSFASISFSDSSNARTLKFTAGTTTTIRNIGGFNVNGTAGKLMTIDSITAATHTLSSTGSQACNYVNIINSIATGGGTFYAGANSTNGGGNTGWRFSFALSFDGASGYVTAGTTDPSAAAMSVGAWINWGSINAGTTSQTIMSKHDGFANSTMRWWFGLDKTNNYKLLVYGNDSSFPFWNYTPPNGTAAHVVWVHNTTAGSETLYVNGTLHSNVAGVTLGTANSTHVQIGASTNGSAEYFKGTIDGVFVNSGTLSPAQVGSVYGGLDANTLSNAYMTYHFDEGTGTTTADATGGRTGTLSGGTIPTWVGGIESIFSGGVAHAMIMMLGIG